MFITISVIFLLSCSSSIKKIKPYNVETEEKLKLLILPFEYKENIFPIESNLILSEKLTDKLKIWLISTNGFEATKIKNAEPKITFNLDYISFSKEKISPPLLEYATDNGYDVIIRPGYNIDTTISSSDTNKIYSIEANMLCYNIKKDEFDYENSLSTVVGVDISLFIGEESIIKNNENNSESNEIEKLNKIVKELIPSFERLIEHIGNDYTKFVYKEETEQNENSENNNEENSAVNENNNSNNDDETSSEKEEENNNSNESN